MKLVRTGLRLHSDDSGSGLAGFGIVILKSDFGFSDCVKVRIHYDDAQNWILVVGAVELEVGAREVLAVNHDLAATLRILRGSMAEAGHFLSARREQLEIGEV